MAEPSSLQTPSPTSWSSLETRRLSDQKVAWDLPATGNRFEFEFIDIFRIKDGQLVERWTSMDMGALRSQVQLGGGS